MTFASQACARQRGEVSGEGLRHDSIHALSWRAGSSEPSAMSASCCSLEAYIRRSPPVRAQWTRLRSASALAATCESM